MGCGPTVDPPRPVDAGETLADTGVEPGDAGFPADTGIVVDGGSVTDSGVAEDAGEQGPVECGGPIQTPCPQGYVCVKNDGLCDGRPNGQIPTGTCQPVLAQCPEAAEDDAVCGCGGATYASRCHAQLHNEDVMEPGFAEIKEATFGVQQPVRRAVGATTTFTAPHPWVTVMPFHSACPTPTCAARRKVQSVAARSATVKAMSTTTCVTPGSKERACEIQVLAAESARRR